MQYLKYLVLPIVLGIFIISCEKKDSNVIDPILKFPSILGTSFTPNTFDSDTINSVAIAQVSSEDPIKQVSVTLVNPSGVGESAIQLHDDGVSPDVTAGDGFFSGRVNFHQLCRLVGNWHADFLAETEAGLFSATSQEQFTVQNTNNQPPVVTSIYLPDSLQLPSGSDTNFIFLKVNVADPNGSCDIVSPAYFNSFKPDGSPSNGNPFSMYDNGNPFPPACDTVANDNKYSLYIILLSVAAPGNYTFKFNCRDRSGAVSDTLFHVINVHP